jgi:hypothetical protein
MRRPWRFLRFKSRLHTTLLIDSLRIPLLVYDSASLSGVRRMGKEMGISETKTKKLKDQFEMRCASRQFLRVDVKIIKMRMGRHNASAILGMQIARNVVLGCLCMLL